MKKILSQSESILQCREWKRNGRRVVLVSGHFALLHPGHVRLLEQARSYGDILLVAIASDASAAGGDTFESVAPLAERAEILAALSAVDFVTSYDQSSPDPLIAQLFPDVIVTGAGSSTPSAYGGQGILSSKASGPEIVRLPLEPGYSTKLLRARIAEIPA